MRCEGLPYNWITLLAVFLLVTPLVFGWLRGLPGELESLKYRLLGALRSVLWLAAYGLSLWGLFLLQKGSIQNLPQLQGIRQLLHDHLDAWAIAIPLGAVLLYWLLEMLLSPFFLLCSAILRRLQGLSSLLPRWLSRMLGALLQAPKVLLRVSLFLLLLHFAVALAGIPALSRAAEESSLYRWADQQVLSPLLERVLPQQIPVLREEANRLVQTLSTEAAQNGPVAGRAFFTWQTRFNSDEQIDATAREVVQGAQSDREKAFRLYTWIGEHIRYDDNKASKIEAGQFQSLSFGAIPTFATRRGVCTDYSSLMVAMGRAVGLKVKQEFGTGILPDGSSGAHAWNVVYLADEQKWIPCDPTWEHAGNFFDNPDFYATHRPDGSTRAA